jgi:hypothetical protein
VRHAINELHKLLPPEIARTEQAERLHALGCVTEMDIVQVIFVRLNLKARRRTVSSAEVP